MGNAEGGVLPRLGGAIVHHGRGGQHFDQEHGGAFDAAGRDLRRVRHHHEVRLHHVMPRQNHVDRGIEDAADTAHLEVILELTLELLRHPLVAGRRSRRHVKVSFQELVALAVGRDGGVVVVVEDVLDADRHGPTLSQAL